ncbi:MULTISPECIES: hypothetical protein [Streptomyces]|uniref:Uncharacterized protein n=4 Tax=Streptomyces TaxID=1883 RepID=A0A8H9HXA1_9ACTN|nr:MULTISPECIES: hypothetical protein [Streptomyces]NEE41647.1 hypothetical protein [Streptomyces sp. SID7982]NEE57646.1 hypothetical protein [Streptomyces sp. SID8455]MBL3807440.1 hypothetical protein [Streptomyces sp. BRB081]MDQ0296549.1 hypothetical protein [Streptomyces sp. DSM 41037]PJM80454.1 hypothetical protein CH313_27995 [Streptomyces sp. TSRI0384-2]
MDDGTDEQAPAHGGSPAGQGAEEPGGTAGTPGEGAPGPAAPAPLGPVRGETGERRVDAALGRLGDVDHLATEGHLTVYEDVHQGLRAALDALDAPPGPSAPPSARPDGSAGRAH